MQFLVTNTDETQVRFSVLNRGAEILQGVKDKNLLASYTPEELIASTELRALLSTGKLSAKDETGGDTDLDNLAAIKAGTATAPTTKNVNPLNEVNVDPAYHGNPSTESVSAASNKFPTTSNGGPIKKGTAFTMTDAGTLGSTKVKMNDTIVAKVDNPGQTESNWKVTAAPAK